MAEIKLLEGELREGDRVTLTVDFSGDTISGFYNNKYWTVFAERNIKWNHITEEYYYEDLEDGEVYTAQNSDDILIRELVPGRLFCRFLYEDLQGNPLELIKVFQVLPSYEVIIPDDAIEGKETTFTNETKLEEVETTFTFSHDGSSITTDTGEVAITVPNDGYYILDTTIDWTNAEYGDSELVVWDSTPPDLLTNNTLGYFGGGSIDNQTLTEEISGRYLIREDIEANIDLKVEFSRSVDNTIDAPLRGFITDNSTYGYTFEGDNRIEYTEIHYGDGYIERSYDINFFKDKLYKKSGEYVLEYKVFTVHDLPEITYRQEINTKVDVYVEPFFGAFFKSLFTDSLYKTEGFHDLTTAWGFQMDRLYNETQALLESLDAVNIDDKFAKGYGATYGDFEEIYEKVGYRALSKTLEDEEAFDLFGTYNFFDRVENGDVSDREKQEFVNYIQKTKTRLTYKGTPASIEHIVAQFLLVASVKELWSLFNAEEEDQATKTDEVFNGNVSENNTGITHYNISMPSTDNEDNLVLDSKSNSYIRINTFDNVSNTYYTECSATETINGKEYLKLNS